jgi:hypothetical protein
VRFVNGVVKVLVFFANNVVMAGEWNKPDAWKTVIGDKVVRFAPEVQAAIKRAVEEQLH